MKAIQQASLLILAAGGRAGCIYRHLEHRHILTSESIRDKALALAKQILSRPLPITNKGAVVTFASSAAVKP